jgi:hypothetical protein
MIKLVKITIECYVEDHTSEDKLERLCDLVSDNIDETDIKLDIENKLNANTNGIRVDVF